MWIPEGCPLAGRFSGCAFYYFHAWMFLSFLCKIKTPTVFGGRLERLFSCNGLSASIVPTIRSVMNGMMMVRMMHLK
jgi:hypothetical protein